MLPHLTNGDLAEVLSGGGDTRTRQHLAVCQECERELQDWRKELKNFRLGIVDSSQKNPEFWGKQHDAIFTRLEEAQSRKEHLRMHWRAAYCALALLLVVAGLVFYRPNPAIEKPANTISDARLIQDIEMRVNEELPDALAPGELLVAEMGGIDVAANNKTSKSTPRKLR